jgi:MYXO-CTERM domain-containing protein
MRCFTEEHRVCTGGAPPCAKPDGDEADCAEPEPEECTLETSTACLPRYFGACEAASDCGEGFTCDAVEECSCGGSSGGGGSDGARPEDAPDGGDAFAPADAGAPTPPDECTCEPTGTNHCVAAKTACTEATAAADCPSGWTCEDNPEGVCFSGPDGSGCTPADPPKLCRPPFSDLGGGARGDDGGENGSVTGGTPIGGDAGAEAPTSGGAGRNGNAAENDDASSGDSGGCSVTQPSSTSSRALAGFALAAFGLTLARRRRR